MNRALLNPFEALKLPDNLELYLESEVGKATCMAFNRHGNVLAVGLSTGHIALWDFDTRNSDNAPVYFVGGPAPSKNSVPEGHHVTTVAFPAPRIGEQILVSFAAASVPPAAANGGAAKQAVVGKNGVVLSEHGTGVIRLCNTLDGDVITELDFDMPILHFVPHPTRANVLVVLPANMYPLLVTMAPGRCSIRKSVYTAPVGPGIVHYFPTVPLTENINGMAGADASELCFVSVAVLQEQESAQNPDDSLVLPMQQSVSGNGRRTLRPVLDPYVVAFSRDGRRMVRGGPDGIVHVLEFDEQPSISSGRREFSKAKVVNWFKVAGGAAIKSLTLTKAKLLVNSADRSLRLFDANSIAPSGEEPSGKGNVVPFTPTAKTTFTEAVNRSQAKCACFSRDGDFVLAGMVSTDAHRIVVWRTSDGHPETTLEGPSEGLLDLLWHPVQPVIASIGAQYGGVYVWAKNFTENWSAFAPEFTELEANEEYSENEGEFDAKHPSSDERVKMEREAEEERIVVNVEEPFCFSSDEENADETVGNGTIRRASKHKRVFSLPAIPEPDSHFPYSASDKDGVKARDVIKGRTPKRQRSRHDDGDDGAGRNGPRSDSGMDTVDKGAGGGKPRDGGSRKRKYPSGVRDRNRNPDELEEGRPEQETGLSDTKPRPARLHNDTPRAPTPDTNADMNRVERS
jgi:WD40 repeat protein